MATKPRTSNRQYVHEVGSNPDPFHFAHTHIIVALVAKPNCFRGVAQTSFCDVCDIRGCLALRYNVPLPPQRHCYGLYHLHYLTTSTYRRAPVFNSEPFKRNPVTTLADLRAEPGLRIIGYGLIPQGGAAICCSGRRNWPTLPKSCGTCRNAPPTSSSNREMRRCSAWTQCPDQPDKSGLRMTDDFNLRSG